jgi:hypothetical protein
MNTRIFTKLSLYAALLCGLSSTAHAQFQDFTYGVQVTAQYSNDNAVENYQNLTDNNDQTKYYIAQVPIWVAYQTAYSGVLHQYTITSANDSPDRDPKTWTVSGSNDGATWTLLDTRTNETFANRFQTNTYGVTNSTPYLYYRLDISANNGSGATQFAGWRILGVQSGPTPVSNITATALTGFKVALTWSDGANDQTGFTIEHSTDGVNFSQIASVGANVRSFIDSGLAVATKYIYRIRAVSAGGVSSIASSTVVSTSSVTLLTDLTNFSNGTISDQYNTTGVEGIAKATDNSIYTKYLTFHNTTWLVYHLPTGGVASQYAITSGNDAPGRDPKNWTFDGSNDGVNWTTLHTTSNQSFADREQRHIYVFNNTTTYTYYRLNITANSGESIIQLSELEIFGSGNGTTDTGAPAAITGLTAKAVSGNQIQLDWNDNATTETNYRIERSQDSSTWTPSIALDVNTTHYNSLNLSGLTTYYYRVRTENDNGVSNWAYAKATTLTTAPPATWQEHWFQHHELLSLVYTNNSVNIYYDSQVPTSVTWMDSDETQVWEYVKSNYGSFSDPKLYNVFHSNNDAYSGGHPASVFDSTHDYRNVTDIGGDWTTRSAWDVQTMIHEIGHIVEGGGRGVDGSPAFAIWEDSKWNEIFIYDVTHRLGWTADAQQSYNDFNAGQDNFPRAGTHWFRDWFYPLYTRSADSSQTLNRFFQLLAQYFPQHNGAYTRDMNMGEFVHFWSGAAQYNLKYQADTAFGWTDEMEVQFKQAQEDFPFTYPEPFFTAPTVAVHEAELPTGVRAWPNPTAGTLYLSLPAGANVYNVDVYSLNGVKVLSQRTGGGSTSLNVSGLTDGLYIVTVNDGGQVIFKKKIVVGQKIR